MPGVRPSVAVAHLFPLCVAWPELDSPMLGPRTSSSYRADFKDSVKNPGIHNKPPGPQCTPKLLYRDIESIERGVSIQHVPLTDASMLHMFQRNDSSRFEADGVGLHAASSQFQFIRSMERCTVLGGATYGGRRNSPRLLWRNATPA